MEMNPGAPAVAAAAAAEALAQCSAGSSAAARQGGRRRRTTFSKPQLAILIKCFAKQRYPGIALRERLASLIAIEESRIQVWFQNRRARQPGAKKKNAACLPRCSSRNQGMLPSLCVEVPAQGMPTTSESTAPAPSLPCSEPCLPGRNANLACPPVQYYGQCRQEANFVCQSVPLGMGTQVPYLPSNFSSGSLPNAGFGGGGNHPTRQQLGQPNSYYMQSLSDNCYMDADLLWAPGNVMLGGQFYTQNCQYSVAQMNLYRMPETRCFNSNQRVFNEESLYLQASSQASSMGPVPYYSAEEKLKMGSWPFEGNMATGAGRNLAFPPHFEKQLDILQSGLNHTIPPHFAKCQEVFPSPFANCQEASQAGLTHPIQSPFAKCQADSQAGSNHSTSYPFAKCQEAVPEQVLPDSLLGHLLQGTEYGASWPDLTNEIIGSSLELLLGNNFTGEQSGGMDYYYPSMGQGPNSY